jgi:hypothetical protein
MKPPRRAPPGPALEGAAEAALLAALDRLGVAGSAQLQAALGRSQPTLSRLLAGLGGQVLALGRGRRTRYALAEPLFGQPARQPLHWVHADGRIERWGTVSLARGGRVHVEGPGLDLLTQGALPWLLAPLRAEGFLGRLLAQRLAGLGLDRQPERWSVAEQLFAALQQTDGPGALVLGEPRASALPAAEDLDARADEAAAGPPPGSSAAGEQPKFLARRADGTAVLVKFSPPRGTHYGERWHDLLHAEALALQVLGEHGVPVARARIVQTARRTALESERFDRVPVAPASHGAGTLEGTLEGRRHVLPLHAVHEAFVGGPRRHWADSVAVLVRQHRLPAAAAAQVEALLRFGRLIGNSDMHFGNLALTVEPQAVAAARFGLAPVYDMLPMRWRPDPASGALDWLPFTPEPADLQSPARAVAAAFWYRASRHAPLSGGLRELARTMQSRLA